MIRKTAKIKEIEQKILPILRSYNIDKAAFFGSAARGETDKNSDVDILVKIGQEIGLLEFIGLKLELEKALGRKVDLVEYEKIKPALKRYILNEQVEII